MLNEIEGSAVEHVGKDLVKLCAISLMKGLFNQVARGVVASHMQNY
jgi:hypothetical protein